MANYTRHPSSFKDPSGFIFLFQGKLYRQVNSVYAKAYRMLMNSGLYAKLVSNKQLVAHTPINENLTQSADWHTTLLPEVIPRISYPYEWSFDELKDAALLTLQVLKTSLQHDMILKDATPFNIQFRNGKPVFIDTLSFDFYDATQPWVAYRQFCECFLFPLYLEYYLKTGIQPLYRAYLNGIPVDITAKLLPLKSRFSLGVWLHVYLQNSVSAGTGKQPRQVPFNKQKLLNLVAHLENIIQKLKPAANIRTTWNHYYDETILDKAYLQEKEKLFLAMLTGLPVTTALDLGANDGYFSRLMAAQNIQVIATDFDSQCINNLYLYAKKNNISNILPLVADIANPSPAAGFQYAERTALDARIHADLVTALALIHHLVISRNIPLQLLCTYFYSIAPHLLIEFVPKADPKVQQMLAGRTDVFHDYDEAHFETYFSAYFNIEKKVPIPGTHRTLYYMKRIQLHDSKS